MQLEGRDRRKLLENWSTVRLQKQQIQKSGHLHICLLHLVSNMSAFKSYEVVTCFQDSVYIHKTT